MHHLRRHTTAGQSSPGRMLAVLLVAQLMVVLDISAVNLALPNLARDLHLSPTDVSWTITSYSLLFGSLLLLGGRAADLLGRRRMFFTGLGIFTAASFASAVAANSAALFAARGSQGLGAALLSPAALSIVTSNFHGPERAKALGAWGAVGGAGAAVGVLLGGVLTQVVDWRAIFFINLPVAAGLAFVGRSVIPSDADAPRWRGLDLRGAAIATVSLGAIVYALTQAASYGWTSSRTLLVGLAGLGGVTAFASIERRSQKPLLRVQRLADRSVGGGFALMLLGAAVVFGTFVLTSLYLQDVLGTGPLTTGLEFLPLAIAAAAGAHAGAQLVARLGVRVPMTAGFAFAAAGALYLSRADGSGSYAADVLPGIVITGVGIGMVMAAIGIAVLGSARDEETGMLSGLNSTGHEIGGTLGIAVLITIATAGSGSGLGAIATSGIDNAFLAVGTLAGFAGILAAVVLPPARVFLAQVELNPAAMPIH